jgi:molybdopterin converting factor small subunit
MPKLILMGSIRQYVGGLGAVEVEGSTVRAAVAALEKAHPALKGWVVDEQGALRRHVKLFVRSEAVALDARLGPRDELHIVAAISGG